MPKDHRERPQRYARILHSIVDDPSFTRMSLEQRGAWITLLVYQDTIFPSCLHRGSVVVRALLGPDHDSLINGMVSLRVLDNLGDGEFDVHGIEGFHVMPSQTAEAVNERVRRHRQKVRDTARDTVSPLPVTGVTSETGGTIHETHETHETHDTHENAPARPTNGGVPSGEEMALQSLAEELTQTPYVLNLHSKLGEMAVRQLKVHGLPAVDRAWRGAASEAGGLPTLGQVVLGAGNRLDPIPVPQSKPKTKGFLPTIEEVRNDFGN